MAVLNCLDAVVLLVAACRHECALQMRRQCWSVEALPCVKAVSFVKPPAAGEVPYSDRKCSTRDQRLKCNDANILLALSMPSKNEHEMLAVPAGAIASVIVVAWSCLKPSLQWQQAPQMSPAWSAVLARRQTLVRSLLMNMHRMDIQQNTRVICSDW